MKYSQKQREYNRQRKYMTLYRAGFTDVEISDNGLLRTLWYHKVDGKTVLTPRGLAIQKEIKIRKAAIDKYVAQGHTYFAARNRASAELNERIREFHKKNPDNPTYYEGN